ncbi:MAG TPA: hypothetical protein PK402_00075 [Tepidisphaeraceae bacterium]|nr:hypothetical protein [Tepidisphaeraceae bacterium]
MVKNRAFILLDSIVAIGALALLIAVVGAIVGGSYRVHQRFERQREMIRIAERIALNLEPDFKDRAIESYQIRIHTIEPNAWVRIEVIDDKHRIELIAPIQNRGER